MGTFEVMDNFKAIFRILSTLEKAMDVTDFDTRQISAGVLGISEHRWARYIEMMQDVGYIDGANIEHFISGDIGVTFDDVRITLKGLEYLTENGIMGQMYRLAKGIQNIKP